MLRPSSAGCELHQTLRNAQRRSGLVVVEAPHRHRCRNSGEGAARGGECWPIRVLKAVENPIALRNDKRLQRSPHRRVSSAVPSSPAEPIKIERLVCQQSNDAKCDLREQRLAPRGRALANKTLEAWQHRAGAQRHQTDQLRRVAPRAVESLCNVLL